MMLRQNINAEARMRELLRENAMPQTEEVEYGHGCRKAFFD
jgi:hypothetical protein